MPQLTVVVPTIPGRESLLSRCLHSITNQQADVAVLVVEGETGLGRKVKAAAEVVETPYMTIVDDDDYLDGGYMGAVLPELGPVDYVGFRFIELNCGRLANICGSSAEFAKWETGNRGPVPKGVTRTSIFRAIDFGDDYTADRQWMVDARRWVKTWAFVDRALYVHDWWPEQSSFGHGLPRDVGSWPHGPVERLTV